MKDWINYIGLLIGLLLGIIGLIFTLRSRHGRPVWKYQSLVLVEGDLGLGSEGVQILCDGVAVSRLTKTYIVFWNHGESTIYGDKVLEPIQCLFSEETQILKATLLARSRKSNLLDVEPSPPRSNRLLFTFHHLDQGHGGKIAVLHTGPPDEPRFTGEIAEVPRGIESLGKINRGISDKTLIVNRSEVERLRRTKKYFGRSFEIPKYLYPFWNIAWGIVTFGLAIGLVWLIGLASKTSLGSIFLLVLMLPLYLWIIVDSWRRWKQRVVRIPEELRVDF